MNANVDKWIDDHKDEAIETLRALLRYRSVNEGGSEPGAPFGRVTEDCLEKMLSVAGSMGYTVKNLDGYAGYADAFDGSETMGILGHLDVVPEGNGWTHDPFGGEIADGRLFGRGTLDDKGPMVAALYAVKAVDECGIKINKKIRLIFGCNEETGMKCLEYYRDHEKLPDFSLSPDGRFPLTSSEKSMCDVTFESGFRSDIVIKGGSAHNSIPGEAFAWINLPYEEVREFCESYECPEGFSLKAEKEDGKTKVCAYGLQSHAANPHEGHNALQFLVYVLADLPFTGEQAERLKGLKKLYEMKYYGENFGLDVEDESGRLTMNFGILDWKEDGYRLVIDIRVPIHSISKEEVHDKVSSAMKAIGADTVEFNFDMGYCIPDDSELVTKVLDVFKKRTGLMDAKPHHIGGGTYSRMLPNAISFGPERYMCESLDHSIDEFIGLDQFVFMMKIYADAIIALCS